MAKEIYTNITIETVTAARDRVLDDLNELTGGNADKAIAYVSEFVELDTILNKYRETQKMLQETS